MSKIQEELKFTLQLLKKEWAEDLEQYRLKTLSASLADKKKEGICWYPVQVIKTKVGMGERLILEVERAESGQSHSFQSGKSISLFSNFSEGKAPRVNGIVNFVRKNTMTITLMGNEWPDWLHDGKLGVDLHFDEASYREMDFAMNSVIKAESGRLGQLRDVFLGEKQADFDDGFITGDIDGLNNSQNEAVRKVLNTQDVAVVHGPPGTGKTTTLVAAIKEVLKRHPQVMVCAPSNAAVDLLVEKLSISGVSTLRIGHPARVDDQILEQTLDAKIAAHQSYRDLKKLRKSVEEYRRMGRKYKRNFGQAEREQRKRLLAEASKAKEAAAHLEDYIIFDVFQQSQVMATTLVGANNPVLKGMKFPVVFIDEAGQGLEPATWIPVMKADKIIMAGDHCQLPPTIKSYEASKEGLSETLFEKVIKRQANASIMLRMQYRMPEMIMKFSSEYFYQGALKAAENTLQHALGKEEPVIEFIDTAGSGFAEHLEKDSLSKLNTEEARFSLGMLEKLIDRLGMEAFQSEKYSISIVSPYKAQVKKLTELLEEGEGFGQLRELRDNISVGTIDGFQGQERDIILISLVRSNEQGEIGFLADIRRMNVALTRARRKLIVVGDSATLSAHPFYQQYLDFVTENGFYKSIYEVMEF
ncbi:AAA family ATPase [Echinicola marina]|uniref:AAA domain-containing protein n=1 Tax=Echinicola marina TaxID=2859768 RepID=UPI001CF656A7|nr:AAA domain-containing protein [Echinicola marina]UCS93430.1 AAA family ATPase [Echinicola marina]